MKGLKYFILFLSACSSLLYGAEFEMAISQAGGWSWRSSDAWYLNKGNPKEKFPTKDDNVILSPQHDTSNFYIGLQLPTAYSGKEISVKSLKAEIGASVDLQGKSGVERFSVSGLFLKEVEVEKHNGKLSAVHDGNFAIAPHSMKSFLHVNFGDIVLRNNATDKTAIMAFGGNDVYGAFHTHRMLASFNAKNINISNHLLFIATENGINANIEKINFEDEVNGRESVLILNGDNQNEAWQQLQTIKVGGLSSVSEGAGIITTKTGSKKIPTKEEARYRPSNFKSDDIIRNGHLEIVGDGGVFSGSIKDNFQKEDTRGKVHITMNSQNGRQFFTGENSYTGDTYIQNGLLAININKPLKNFYLRGGKLSLFGANPTISKLHWHSGSLVYDLKKASSIVILEEAIFPLDFISKLEFSNIVARKNYTLLELKNANPALRLQSGKRIAVKDKSNGKNYTAMFGASDLSLTVVFISE